MKVFLVLYLCSSVANTCLNPIIIPDPFEDDYTCLLDGYNKSYEKLVEIQVEFISSLIVKKLLFHHQNQRLKRNGYISRKKSYT